MRNMRESIEQFVKQFLWEPVIENAGELKLATKFLVAGMGGSHLAGDVIRLLNPSLDLRLHKDYSIPRCVERDRLVVCCSFSGNTEEVVTAYTKAVEDN